MILGGIGTSLASKCNIFGGFSPDFHRGSYAHWNPAKGFPQVLSPLTIYPGTAPANHACINVTIQQCPLFCFELDKFRAVICPDFSGNPDFLESGIPDFQNLKKKKIIIIIIIIIFNFFWGGKSVQNVLNWPKNYTFFYIGFV